MDRQRNESHKHSLHKTRLAQPGKTGDDRLQRHPVSDLARFVAEVGLAQAAMCFSQVFVAKTNSLFQRFAQRKGGPQTNSIADLPLINTAFTKVASEDQHARLTGQHGEDVPHARAVIQ